MRVTFRAKLLMLILASPFVLAACSSKAEPAIENPSTCPVTKPQWALHPEDAAISGTPAHGYYFINEAGTIWASAWWSADAASQPISREGIKMGWFRPAGASLEITGERIDGPAPALDAHVPCCYPTRFQATGLTFPEEGCWRISATAGGENLEFVVQIVFEEGK